MVVPEPRDGRWFYERLRNPVVVGRRVHGRPRRILVEPTRRDCSHACTVDEIVELLAAIEEPDLDALELIVLRQPTRKQELLRPVWGRMIFDAEIAAHRGPALVLEAVNRERAIKWSRSLSPHDAAELERLRCDGHPVRETKRAFIIEPSLAAARRTQLERTILHEIGHLVDWRRFSDKTAYWRRAWREREGFADTYADQVGAQLRARGVLPLERNEGHAPRRGEGLHPSWFA